MDEITLTLDLETARMLKNLVNRWRHVVGALSEDGRRCMQLYAVLANAVAVADRSALEQTDQATKGMV